MAVLTRRDRIAVIVLIGLIVAGWGIRYVRDTTSGDGFTVHRDVIPVPAELTAPEPTAPAADALFAPVDINTATAGELAVLPMIGPARAAAIISYREEHGPFVRPEDLTAVNGIGPGILARIRPDITTGTAAGSQTASDSTGFGEK